VLDTQNFMRKGPGDVLLGKIRPDVNEPCVCSLCLPQETKAWAAAIERGETYDSNNNDLLLPPRVFGYALIRKEWCQFALDNIEVIVKSGDGYEGRKMLEELEFPKDVDGEEQEDIRILVKNHSRVMAKPPQERIGDMVGGKGESLILLFHGMSDKSCRVKSKSRTDILLQALAEPGRLSTQNCSRMPLQSLFTK